MFTKRTMKQITAIIASFKTISFSTKLGAATVRDVPRQSATVHYSATVHDSPRGNLAKVFPASILRPFPGLLKI